MSTNVARERLSVVIAEYLDNDVYDDYEGLLRLSLNEETVCQVMMMIYAEEEERYLQIQGILASPLENDVVGGGYAILRLLKDILLPASLRLLVNPIHQNGAWIDRLIKENQATVWIYTFEWIDRYNKKIVPFTAR